MEIEELEAILETIWDLHDKISDAIHAISRTNFLKSIKALTAKPTLLENEMNQHQFNSSTCDEEKIGYVFVKSFSGEGDDVDDDAEAMAEARSLNSIRNALENLEDQLEFFLTVQSQQRAERDTALARVEQSRIVLAMRLADHQGRKYKVIEEALAFVGNVHDSSHFVSPENLFEPSAHANESHNSNLLIRMFISSMTWAKSCVKMEKFGGVMGNATLFAVSMIAFLQLHRIAFKTTAPLLHCQCFYTTKNTRSEADIDNQCQTTHLDVYSARG